MPLYDGVDRYLRDSLGISGIWQIQIGVDWLPSLPKNEAVGIPVPTASNTNYLAKQRKQS